MAYPGDPSGPAPKGPGAFATARLTPDDFEQLAAAFRPSWEFDEGAFTGPGSMSASELRTLQGSGGTHGDVRASAALTNGANGAPASRPMTAQEPQATMVERGFTAADIPPPSVAPAPTPAPTPFGPPVVMVQAVPVGALAAQPSVIVASPQVPAHVPAAPASVRPPPSADRLAQTRIVQRPVPSIPVAKDSTGSFDLGRSPFGKSKRPLWIALGIGVVALAGVGIWQATSGPSETAPSPPPTAAATATPAPKAPDVPPPPPETAAAPLASASPQPRTVSVSALAQVPMPTPPSAPPPPRQAAPAPQPRPAPAPAPRPAVRTKPAGGGTIVHDVPF